MLTLSLQLVAIFGCCLGVGLTLFRFVPKSLPALSKLLFSVTGGLFLMVLVLENLIYLGVPVRISGWFLVGLAAFQFYLARREWGGWIRTLRTNADIQVVGMVAMLTVAFHSAVPIQQDIGSYYGT